MDPTVIILGVLTSCLGILANAFVALLFWRIKRMDQDIELMKRELIEIRLNYLDRFEDVKDHQNKLHLQTVEKISILETLLQQNINK